MAGGFRTPDMDVIDTLQRKLAELGTKIRELEMPTGTQLADAVATLTQLVNDLPGQIYAALATAVNTGAVNATGNISAGGTISAGGLASFPAGVSSLDARNRVLSTGFAGAWIDSSGRFGIQPSSRRFKKDIVPWVTDISKLLELRRVTFRYITAIDDDPDAMSKPKQLGFIAEELIDLGFTEFVFYDETGLVQGINYDRMVVALLELAVFERERNDQQIADLSARLSAGGL